MKENLSALIDDELDDHTSQQVLDRLHADAQFRDEFALHMVIGDALRGDVGMNAAFTASVMSRLDDEPTVLAPVARPAVVQPRRMWMSAAAAAAGVALVSWFGLDLMPADAPMQLAVTPVSSPAPAPTVVGTIEGSDAPLRAYLVAHHGYSPTGSMQGVALYARGVSDIQTDRR
jgi:sigma-E factor negative regulatory protein RseA